MLTSLSSFQTLYERLVSFDGDEILQVDYIGDPQILSIIRSNVEFLKLSDPSSPVSLFLESTMQVS